MIRYVINLSLSALLLIGAASLSISAQSVSTLVKPNSNGHQPNTISKISLDSCCQGTTGNIDNDRGVDIADLTFLIDHLYINFPAIPCPEEGNIDGLGGVDIADLTFLIDHLFINFPDLGCQLEGNIDGEGGIDIADLTFLIDHLFINFPDLPACP